MGTQMYGQPTPHMHTLGILGAWTSDARPQSGRRDKTSEGAAEQSPHSPTHLVSQ